MMPYPMGPPPAGKNPGPGSTRGYAGHLWSGPSTRQRPLTQTLSHTQARVVLRPSFMCFSQIHDLSTYKCSLGRIPSAHGDTRLACSHAPTNNSDLVTSFDAIAHQITTHGLVASFSSCTAAVLAASAPSPSPPRTCRCLAAKLPSMFRSRLQPLNVVTCVRARPASVRVRMTGSVQAQDDLLEA